MSDLKRARIEAITDEVKHFHPLLAKLLPKLPNVRSVDHTHGPNEMGADFVVTMEDKTFGAEYYVGVIAKIGGVEQSSVDDIERQIAECEIERLTTDGRKKITLTEFWVATNGNISANSQKKIHAKFASRSIKFIHKPILTRFIDDYLSSYWTDIDLEIADYLSKIAERNAELDQHVSLLQLGSKPFYIEQDVTDKEVERYDSRGRKEARLAKVVNIFSEIVERPVILVEAAAGMGKSKLLRTIVERFANPLTYHKEKIIPVYLAYSTFVSKHGRSLTNAINNILGEKTVSALSDDVKVLLLIDGMDEKDESTDEQRNSFDAILTESRGNHHFRVVVTTRYLGNTQESELSDNGVTLFELRELTLKKVADFLTKICTQVSLTGRILEDLKRSPLFKQLPKSPIAAILLGRLLRDNQKEIPSNMTELYAQYLEIILGRWDIEKGLQTQKEYEALDSILTDIATYFVENELSFLSIDEAMGYFTGYLGKRNLGVSAEALFQKMVNRCEIVFVDSERNRLAFKHRTFAEFLYAKRLVRTGKTDITTRALDVYWMNVYFFMAGILKDCPKQIEQYLNLIPENEMQQWLKILNTGGMLLAGFATPYDHVESAIRRVYLETAKLYKDAIDGTRQLAVAKAHRMSAVELLGLCQWVLKHNYSFEFFHNAIENAAYALEADETTKDYRPYALFFLFTTSLALGKPEAADLVIRALGADIPLAIRLGFHIEGKSIKDKSKALKKLEKHTMDVLRANKSTFHRAHVLLQAPLVKSDKPAKPKR